MRIEGKTFITTGGASGLGRAAAEAILGAGGSVLLLDVNDEVGQATAQTLGDRAGFVKADVTSEAEVQAAVDEAVTHFGGLHGVVNAAGIGPAAKVLGKNGPHPLDLFEKTIRINLTGTFNVIRLAAAAIAKNTPEASGERGVIVNTASIAAYDGQIGQPAYAASKGGIVGADAAGGARVRADRHPRGHDRAGHLRHAAAGGAARGGAGVAGPAGAVPVAARPPGRVRRAGPARHRERDAERRGDPAGRRAAHGADGDLPISG